MSKTILVTGGAGYIGSQTCLELVEKGFKIIIFDNLVYGHQYNIFPGSEFILGDLADYNTIANVFKTLSIDGVIHFAAYAYNGESVTDPQKYYYNNVVGTMNLLQAMLEYNVKHIVFSSTCGTYGIPEKNPISEETPQRPISPYGKSKLMVEQILQDYAYAYSLNAIALRYFNAAGADPELRTGEDHTPETHLIPIILEVAQGKRKKITIFGNDYNTPDGTCIRDYIHTKDLASAHILSLEKLFNGQKGFDSFNLGTGKGYSNMEVVRVVEKVTGTQIAVEMGPRRDGDWDISYADNSKAKTVLGWNPQYSDLETIVATAWAWVKKNTSK